MHLQRHQDKSVPQQSIWIALDVRESKYNKTHTQTNKHQSNSVQGLQEQSFMDRLVGSWASLGKLQIGTNNYLPDEDVGILQFDAFLQADVLQHIVHVKDEAVQKRDEGNGANTDHILLHIVYPIAASRGESHEG